MLLSSKTFLLSFRNISSFNLPLYLEKIRAKEKYLEGCFIMQDKENINILLRFTKRKIVKDNTRFLYIIKKEYEIVKISQLLEYFGNLIIAGNYLNFGFDIDTILQTGSNKVELTETEILNDIQEQCAKQLMSLEEIIDYCNNKGDKYKLVLFKHNRMVKNIVYFSVEYKTIQKLKIKKFLNKSIIERAIKQYKNNYVYLQILNCLLAAVEHNYNRFHKHKNLHIYSEYADMGKTSLLLFLAQHLHSYYYPPIKWFNEYFNYKYSLIIWDEFKIPKDINHFNLFFEGVPIDLPVKYSQNVTKVDNPLIFCSSNKSIKEQLEIMFKEQCKYCVGESLLYSHIECKYSKSFKTILSTTSARIIEIKIVKPLFNLIDYLKRELV